MLRRILIILGAFVAILPYLGLPRSWDNVLLTLAGLLIVILVLLRRRPRSSDASPEENDARVLPRGPQYVRTDVPDMRHVAVTRPVADTPRERIPMTPSTLLERMTAPVASSSEPKTEKRRRRKSENSLPASPDESPVLTPQVE